MRASSSGSTYDGASVSRRTMSWAPSRVGPSTALVGTLDLMRARCRDEVRNNPWAASAVDNFESQISGNGIRPHWNLPGNLSKKQEIETLFARWARRVNFYGVLGTAVREIFEGGEVFCRLYTRPPSWNLTVPLDLQLIEGEQVPVFLNTIGGSGLSIDTGASVRCGIEFDTSNRISAYHMYRQHPGETMFYPLTGLTYMRVPADDVVHCFKPLRAGLLRGQPHLASVLTLLHEISKYTDAAVVKKQIQTMFAAFIQKTDPNTDILPIDTSASNTNPVSLPPDPPPGVQNSTIETGTIQELFPGESITFPNLPQDNDIETFLSVCLHQYAVGIGATYEQITGDLRGVNLSSIRAGILDFRRKCEQFQYNVLIASFIAPIVKRWVKEAVLTGAIFLPGYAVDPELYDDIEWGKPGWPWIDPLKDAQAKLIEVRSGFDSRESICSDAGRDAATIDSQQETDNKRAEGKGLVYDSNTKTVLLKGTKLTAEGEAQTGGVAGLDPNADAGAEDEEVATPTGGKKR